MKLIIALFLAIIAVEYVFRVPLLLHSKMLISVANRSVIVIRSKKISDHWKEIVLLRYARELTRHTLSLAFMLLGLFLLVFLPAFLIDYLSHSTPSIIEIFSSLTGLFTITIVTISYAVVRQRFH